MKLHSFNEFILEQEQNEYIDFDRIDLQQEYDQINKKVFRGKLKPITLKWVDEDDVGGKVVSTRVEGEPEKIEYLAISKYYKLTRTGFLSILTHEMIHVEAIQQGLEVEDPHGNEFLQRMKEVNAMDLGYKISVKYNASNVPVNNDK